MRRDLVAGGVWLAMAVGIVLIAGWPVLALIYVSSWALGFGAWWWTHTWPQRH